MESFGDALEALERSGGKGDEPFVAPSRIRRTAAPGRNSETRLHFRGELRGAGISACRVDRSSLPGSEPSRDLVGVEPSLAHSVLREISDGKVFVPDHHTYFALSSFTSHATAKGAQLGKSSVVLDALWSRIAVNNNRFVTKKITPSVIIAPDALF